MRRFFRNQSGQDLIEYMLLTAFLAIGGYVGIQVLSNSMRDSYVKGDSAIQDVWETPEPCKQSGRC